MLRIFQVIMPLFAIALFGLPTTLIAWICTVGVFVLIESYAYAMVFCIADETGLHFQRWTRWNHVKWKDLVPPRRQPLAFYKMVEVRNKSLWNRYLLLPGSASLHQIHLNCEQDRAIRDRLQDGFTGR